jgi:hypothetical protein
MVRAITKSGDLDAALAVQQELNAIKGVGGTATGGKVTPELTALKSLYEANVQTASEAIQIRYIKSLETLQDKFTKDGNLTAALAVRQELAVATTPSSLGTAKGAVVRVSTPDAIKVLQLKPGQPRLYDSNPLRKIEKVDPKLSTFEFTAIPQRLINSYEIIVDQPGVIYAFGAFKDNMDPEKFLGKDASRWQAADGMIQGKNVWACFQRTVVAGEAISLRSFELQIAAGSIRRITKPAEKLQLDGVYRRLGVLEPACATGHQKALAEIRSPKPAKPRMISSVQPVPMMIVIPPARIPEEPGAVIPHAGICEGGVRQPASLP